MATEVKFKIILPGRIFISRAIGEDIITRYMRSDFMRYSSDFVYYDTPDWDLCENGYLLRVCTSGDSNAATLRCGSIDQSGTPGLYTGQGWTTYFHSTDSIVEDYMRRGAHSQFEEYASRGALDVRFSSHRERMRANLYLPERTRLDFALDDGELTVDGRSEPLRHMSFTLSYGDLGLMTNYCEQIMREFGLSPDLVTMQRKAVRLLRSR